MVHRRSVNLAAVILSLLAGSAYADVGLTYLGAFRALPGNPSVYGDMTFYPAGNGGAGSIFVGSTLSGSLRIYEVSIPELKISSDISELNVATTLNTLTVSQAVAGLVWRSTDDRLYYSTTATGYQNMNFRSINRDGTDESANHPGPGWREGGFGLTQIPDDWAATYAEGKNLLTVGPVYGPKMSAVDPWNAETSITIVVQYPANTPMIGFEYGDSFDSLAWVEVGAEKSIILGGFDKATNASTLWMLHVSDIEAATSSNPPQPYKVMNIDSYMLVGSHSVFGMSYDAANHILYTAEGAYGKATIIHAWQCADVPPADDPPSPIIDLAASEPTLTSVTLTWKAPADDRGAGNRAASYDVRYSTAEITEANWDGATQAEGEPTPSAPAAPETFVVTGLAPETTYYFALKSVDEAGHVSALSNVVSAMTLIPDRTPPARIENLAAVNVQSTQLQLRWTASGDDGMTGAASAYDVRYSTSPIDEANFAAATEVVQSMTPGAAGQVESLLVTGLTPSTTYYFAIKAIDNEDNASPLSNVVEVTTQAPDVTAPAAVVDLAAGSVDALSAALTWTASGDDGQTGTAAAYEIRYSTSTITEGTWAAATLAPNILAPQAAGGTESFTVIGLQPGMTYYFALKVRDEEGNVSGLSNVASCTTSTLPDLPLVTTVTLVEKQGVTTDNYPVTLSMVFRKGDVADHVTVRAGGLVLPTQTDVKVRWDDGSVRHGLVSFVIPQLEAGESLTVELLSGGPNYSAGGVTREQLLASDFEALMTILAGSTRVEVSARQILANMPTVEYWMKGGIATEFIIRDWNARCFGQLNVSYRVRVYPGAGAIRVSTVVDNTWIDARGNFTYDVSLSLGRSTPQPVYSKANLTHFHSARWHKVFWQGEPPPKIEVRYNLPYMIATGAVPNYDTSLVVSASALTNTYNGWLASAHDIMDGAQLTKYFPTTGGRGEIAPYPRWASLYLCSMDYRMAEVTINYGDLSGTIPIHFREADPARSFYCRPISVDDRPTIRLAELTYSGIQPADRFPAPIGDLSTPWTVDIDHQPSLAYIPYLITGDLYYLEEMHFWACYDLGATDSGYRGGTACWLIYQVRGNAWALRNIVDAAAMTPDDMPEKAYLNAKIANNIDRWNNNYILPTIAGAYPTVRYYVTSGLDSSLDPATCSAAMSSWQSDYLTWSLVHAYQMGYPTLDLVHWAGQGLIDRFSDWPGWNRYRGTVYVFPARGKDADGNSVPFATWADVNNGFLDKVGPSAFSGDTSYVFTSRGTMALVTSLPKGMENWTWLDNALAAFKSDLASDPRWAFVPPTQPTGDIDGDGSVDVVDLLYLVDTFDRAFGDTGYDPRADFNGDFGVDVVDLLIFVEHFGM